jgi:hypothetical protein
MGKKAMLLAMIYPEPEKGGRGKKSEARKLQETCGFSRESLDSARYILRNNPLLAKEVVAGKAYFDTALAEVQGAEKTANSNEQKLVRLREQAPGRAAKVTTVLETKSVRSRHCGSSLVLKFLETSKGKLNCASKPRLDAVRACLQSLQNSRVRRYRRGCDLAAYGLLIGSDSGG